MRWLKRIFLTPSFYIFLFVLICAFMICCFPLLLSCFPKLYYLTNNFLSSLHTHDNKRIYLETVGILWGSFLAITGAIWVQAYSNKVKEQSEKSINALMIANDLESVLNNIISLYPAIFKAKEISAMHVRYILQENPISILPNWRLLALTIGCDLFDKELSLLLSTYNTLEAIFSLSKHIDSIRDADELIKLLNILLDQDQSKYKCKKKINQLIEKIRKI